MSSLIEVDYVEVKHVTDGAHLLDFGDFEEWVPNTVIEHIDEDTVTIPKWKARELGLSED